MTQQSIEVQDAAERLFVEQALALFREMRGVARQAADGEVLDQAEVFAVRQGRELIRQGLQSVLQEQAEEVEKKGRLRGPVAVEPRGPIGGARRKRSRRPRES